MASFDWKDVPAGTPALSIKQPWAWLILHAGKDIENRTWRTRYRGPLLIHAGKSPDRDAPSPAGVKAHYGVDLETHPIWATPDRNPPLGCFVGVVDLIDCVETHSSRWFHGPIGWVLGNPRTLPLHEAKGRLGLWRPTFSEGPLFDQGAAA